MLVRKWSRYVEQRILFRQYIVELFERALKALLSFQYSYWKGRTGGYESGKDAIKTRHRGW